MSGAEPHLLVEKRDGTLVQWKPGAHVAEMSGQNQVECPWTGDEVDWTPGLWATACQVGYETSILVEELDIHEPGVIVDRISVDIVEEVVFPLWNHLAGEFSIRIDTALNDLIESLHNHPLTVAVHQLRNSFLGEPTGRHQSTCVAFQHFRKPAVVQNNRVRFTVDLSLAHNPDRWNQHSLVKDLGGVR